MHFEDEAIGGQLNVDERNIWLWLLFPLLPGPGLYPIPRLHRHHLVLLGPVLVLQDEGGDGGGQVRVEEGGEGGMRG